MPPRTDKLRWHSAVPRVGIVLVIWATAGCAQQPYLFTSHELDGVQVQLKMPTVNSEHPLLTVDVAVAGGPVVPLLVDTGSPGLRIFSDQVGADGLVTSATESTATYIDGTTLTGVEAQAPVSIGNVSTAGPITIQLINSVTCEDAQPDCVGSGGIERFASDQSFAGILGIGLMEAPVYSPLMQLAGGPPSTFSIRTTPESSSGTLTFNLTPTNPAAAYSMPAWPEPRLPNNVPAWSSNEAKACWAFAAAAPQCLTTSFDSGSPFILATTIVPGAPSVGNVAAGVKLLLFPDQKTEPVWVVMAGSAPGVNQMSINTPTNGGSAVNTGLAVFSNLSVTFDISRGQILLSP